MTDLYQYILNKDDPFEYVYDAISGHTPKEITHLMTELYNDVVIDYGYHPDDDFEKIIERMIELMEDM